MLDERAQVIARLNRLLMEVGVHPDRPFSAVYTPGQGWAFFEDEVPSGSSSSLREERLENATNVQTSIRR